MSNIYYKVAKAASFALALSISAAGLAQSDKRETVTREVRTAGIDLTSADGLQLLDARISQVVRHMCGHSAIDLKSRMEYGRCHREAMGSVSRQVELAVAKARSQRFATAPTMVEIAAAKGM